MTTVESSTQLPFWIGDTTKGNKGWTIAKDGEEDDNTFQIGDAFDVKTGAFTATTDGYYMVQQCSTWAPRCGGLGSLLMLTCAQY